MLCPHCGHQNEEGIRFCTGCGELLSKKVRGRAAETPTTGTPAKVRTPKNRKGFLLGLAIFVICILAFKLFSRILFIHRISTSHYSPPAPPAVPFSPPAPPSPALSSDNVTIPAPAIPKPSAPSSPQINSIEKEPVIETQEKERVVEKTVLLNQDLDRFSNLPAKTEEEFKKFKQDEGWRLLQTIGLNIQFDQLCRKAEDANKKRDWQEVIDLYLKALRVYPYYDASFRIANSYNQLNQPDKALVWALAGLQKFRYNLLYEIAAESYCKKGDEIRMLAWLEGALKGGFKASKEDLDRRFSRYKDDPRYSSLLQKYNITF